MTLRHAALFLLLAAGCARGAFDPDREEGIHDRVQVEWWYHWGYLTDEDGNEWTCFSSFFRTWKEGLPLMRYFLYDLTDLRTGERRYRSVAGPEVATLAALLTGDKLPPPHEVFARSAPEPAGAPLRLAYGDDRLERTGDRLYRLQVGEVDLELRAVSEPMMVEGTGLTGASLPEDMHYYTIPRLEAAGTVRGRKARGLFWYDHQWGSSWVGPEMGWSWWGLQLEDGTNVNAYTLRELKSGKILRAVSTRDRSVEALESTPLEFWESPTKVRYPVSWRLRTKSFDVRVDPIFKERESPVLGEQESIWEGPVRATGSVGGKGFQELVGYARERKKK